MSRSTYLRLGRHAWATLGLAGLLALVLFVLAHLRLVAVPLVLAPFPAALLAPLADRLRRRLPDALAALAAVLALLLGVAAVVAMIVPVVVAELPDLADSFARGLAEVDAVLRRGVLGFEMDGTAELLERAREQLAGSGELAGGAFSALTGAVEFLVGTVLLFVVLFFYLKDGRRLARGVASLLPVRPRAHAWEVSARVWDAVGGFLRGQLLVALVDAVFIGIGLALLRVPLALPLAVVVFFGGLFPIVGAFLSGLVAVLVALADSGLMVALGALAIIVVVQQVESNVLEPLVLGRVVRLHPLVVVAAIGVGAVVAGVLGAFLAVPVAASLARALDYAREVSGGGDGAGGPDRGDAPHGGGGHVPPAERVPALTGSHGATPPQAAGSGNDAAPSGGSTMEQQSRPPQQPGAGGGPGAHSREPGGAQERRIVVDASAARAVVDLLELLSELPSTPDVVADVTRERAGEVAAHLPTGGAATHPQGVIELEATGLVSAAALLQLLGQMESTPPVVAEDARSWSMDLWARLDREPMHPPADD